MKKILISLGGECSSNIIEELYDFQQVIAVDSGVDHLFNLNINPNVLIGDLDSIESESLELVKKLGINIIQSNTNKDKTDFELALEYIEEKNNKEIYIIGGENGEVDHLFSILFLISSKDFYRNISWLYGNKKILINNSIKVKTSKNSEFSVLPLTDIKSLSISGAKWNLKNEDILYGQTLTLRNKTKENILSVTCDEGKFALIY